MIDLLLALVLTACRLCALPLAVLDGLVEAALHPRVLGWIGDCPGGAWRQLPRIRFIRLARHVLKVFILAGWERPVLQRIRVDDPGGKLPAGACVLAICHTAWGHAAVRWLVACHFALVLAGRRWASEAGECYAPRSGAGLRRLLRHLRVGGRAAVAVTSFAERGGCEERFFGVPVRVSLVSARLAGAAGVPLVPTWVTYRGGRLLIEFGTGLDVAAGRPGEALRRTLDCFERWIREDPGQWNDCMPFLRLAAGAGAP